MREASPDSACRVCGTLLRTWNPTGPAPPGTHPCPKCRKFRAVSTTGRCVACSTPIAGSEQASDSTTLVEKAPLFLALALFGGIGLYALWVPPSFMSGAVVACLALAPIGLIVFYVRSQV